MKLTDLVAAACLLLASSTAMANDPAKGWVALMSIFSQPEQSIDKDKCDVAIKLDYGKYMQRMGDIRDAWLYKDNPVEYYQRRGYQILTIVARKEATQVTEAIFDLQAKSSISSCRFRIFATDQDKFGNEKPFVVVSWGFNRELGRKVNWDRLDDRKFPELAIDYKFGQEFERRMMQEPGQ